MKPAALFGAIAIASAAATFAGLQVSKQNARDPGLYARVEALESLRRYVDAHEAAIQGIDRDRRKNDANFANICNDLNEADISLRDDLTQLQSEVGRLMQESWAPAAPATAIESGEAAKYSMNADEMKSLAPKTWAGFPKALRDDFEAYPQKRWVGKFAPGEPAITEQAQKATAE